MQFKSSRRDKSRRSHLSKDVGIESVSKPSELSTTTTRVAGDANRKDRSCRYADDGNENEQVQKEEKR